MSISEKLKNKLFVEAGNSCAICGKPYVQIHHIDGNENNNNEDNLIVLCANHHAEAEMSKKGRGFTAILTPERLRLYKEKQKQELIYRERIETPSAGIVVLPIPPMPYFAHPYPIQENFTGRLSERQELTEWFTKDTHPTFAYVAIGGMGKSALTWYWLQEDIIKQGLAPEGIIWWSFYDREARFETFLEKAIKYVSKGENDPKQIPGVRDKMETLYTFLCNNRFLVVLDGVERVLRAYAGLGSPYRGDEVEEDKKQEFRMCIDPNVGTFLQWLASANIKTKTLLTSRLCPKEMDDIAGCVHMELKELKKEDAVDFFHRQGVKKGTRAEIESACEPFGYHPLSLRLLSGMIVKDPKYMGDITVWTKYNPLPELKGKERHNILEIAYNSLDKKKQTLISKLSAFRNPMPYDSISIFNEYKDQKKFDETLIELVDRGLLLRDLKSNKYDLHPIIRRYCYDILTDKTVVHSQLRDYFATVPEPLKVEFLDDLAPVIELYHHTVKSERYDDAWGLFRNRLHDQLYYSFGAYIQGIELMSALFPGNEELPKLKEDSHRAWLFAALGNFFSVSGQPKKAVPLFEKIIDYDTKKHRKLHLATGLGNFASVVQTPLGELESAELNLRRSINLFQQIKDEFGEAASHQWLGRLLAYKGKFEESERELAKSTKYWVKTNNQQGLCLDESYRALGASFMSDTEEGLKSAKKAYVIALSRQNEQDRIQAEWLLGAAYLAKGNLKEAEKHLDEALRRDRRINLVEIEPDILLELAKLRFEQGHKEDAMKLAEEALEIADRCEYRLKQADIHNFLAEFYYKAEDFSKAKEHVIIAKERAECGYVPAMKRAEELEKLISQQIKGGFTAD